MSDDIITEALRRYKELAGGMLDEVCQSYREDFEIAERACAVYANRIAEVRREVAPTPLTHGHRTDYFLLANARRMCGKAADQRPNWALATDLFATGSASARQICKDAGVDPDGFAISAKYLEKNNAN